jgi:glyoxylase-like metal-dependent hydrolase (beta-lactamase superfamily II)
VPAGLTWPTITFTGKMTLWLGKLEVQILQLGRGHTKGDTVVWLPAERFCSAATWSNSTPRPTPATPTSKTGRRRWTTSPR